MSEDNKNINTKEQNKKNAEYLVEKQEKNVLDALLRLKDATENDELRQRITVNMPGTNEELFSFEIRPLKESEINKAREGSRPGRVNKFGERPIDQAKFRSKLIYMATVDSDKEKLWDNPVNLNKFDTHFPEDIIDVIPAGVKLQIVDAIERLSGFSLTEDLVQVEELKN